MKKIIVSILFAVLCGCSTHPTVTTKTPSNHKPSQPVTPPVSATPPVANVSPVWTPALEPSQSPTTTDPYVLILNGFVLGTVSGFTHTQLQHNRDNCKKLNGTWDYINTRCNQPAISVFFSDRSGFSLIPHIGAVSFFYNDNFYLNNWLEYLYQNFGEPVIDRRTITTFHWERNYNNVLVKVYEKSFIVAIYPPVTEFYFCRTDHPENQPFTECFLSNEKCLTDSRGRSRSCSQQSNAACVSATLGDGSVAVSCWTDLQECTKFCEDRMANYDSLGIYPFTSGPPPCISECSDTTASESPLKN